MIWKELLCSRAFREVLLQTPRLAAKKSWAYGVYSLNGGPEVVALPLHSAPQNQADATNNPCGNNYHKPKPRHPCRGGQACATTDGVVLGTSRANARHTCQQRTTRATHKQREFSMITLNANGLDVTTMACLLHYAEQCKFPDVICIQEAKTELVPGVGYYPYKAILNPPNKEETNEPIGGTVILVHKRWWGGLNELSNLLDEGDVC